MKKQFLTGLAVVAAASMLCGFDSAETLDSLSEKMAAAEVDLQSMSMNMDISFDAALNMSDGTNTNEMPISATGSMQVDYTLDPIAMKMDGSYNVAALSDGQDVTIESYMTTGEDGTMTMYVKDPTSGSWAAQSDPSGINMKDLMDSATGQSMSFGEMAEWGLNFELAPEAADVDGAECYLLSCTIDSAALNTILQKASETTGQDLTADEDVSMVLSLFDGIVMNIEYYVDASTYLPAKMHMDLNGSDLSTISSLVSQMMAGATAEGAASTTIELVLNDCSIDATIAYNSVDEIVIPDEVLAAPNADVDVSSVTDAIAEAE